MIRRSDRNIKKGILSLLIITLLTGYLYSQNQNIGGIINIYKRVVAIGPGTDNITLNDVSGINPGDIVLLIQMKGSLIYVPDPGPFGSYRESVGATGKYEFLVVESVNGGTVIFTNPILNPYDLTGLVQLVKVPFYSNSAVVTSTLTCETWDGMTGGVLTMIVGKSLSLKANIDVTGKGFIGGIISSGPGNCQEIVGNDNFGYPDTYNNSGFKGESQAILAWVDPITTVPIFPTYSKGKGTNFTGGGGGNGRFSGGGGGSNYGTGGKGGREMATCTTPDDGGLGGRTIKFLDIDGGIFLGSGGGASTYETIPTATPGGNGGGIIIILCETLKGKGKIITAEGATPSLIATGNAGAGGGGGGGTIALYQQSFSTPLDSSALTISANGGKGGRNAGAFGEGGGGGGGFILTNNISLPSNVLKTVNGGAVGTRSGGSTGGAGDGGESLITFSPVLNGFLFNSIWSSVTLDKVDSICSDVPFGTITGTTPVGGVPPYTIMWQSSTTSESAGFIDIPFDVTFPNNSNDYTPPGLLTQNTWFRRRVMDSDVTTDISKAVKIIVQPAITGNMVGNDATICFNQKPIALIPLNAGPSNGSIHNYYLYKWIQNNTNTNWNTSPDASGANTSAGYAPPALASPTYYQRVVTSGRCVNNSSTVTITVLPSITGNITARPDSVICQGSLFNNLAATAPGGGDGVTYTFQWQDSITSSVWTPAVGTNSGASYTLDTLTFAVVEKRYLRRTVTSGPGNVCKSKSVPILLTRYHKLVNNSILADQTICSSSAPVPLSGSVPLQGKSGEYSYIWQDSIKTGVWTSRGTTDFTHAPGILTDTTWYRRIVNSSKCTNTSLPVKINVHKPLANFNITLLAGGFTDTTICNGQTPHILKGTVATGGTSIPGSYAYQWKYSADNTTFTAVPSGGNGITYQPSALTTTTYFKREVTSGACIVSSNPITIIVLPLITNNTISGNSKVCYSRVPDIITGVTLSGGSGTYNYLWEQSADGGSLWGPATGANNTPNYQAPALFTAAKYKRTVKSGLNDCCSSISNVFDIGIDPLPASPVNAGPDTTIFSVEKIYHMRALSLFPGETGGWRILYNGASSIDDTTNYKTIVRYLALGKNSFLWTISRGLCNLKDSVTIELLKDFIPQGFSPNGDAWNNTFVIEGLNKEDNYLDLSIVNGAGTEVFSTSNRNSQVWTDWEGKNSNGLDLSEGTYYYMLKITPKKQDGSVYKKSGFIILKRY